MEILEYAFVTAIQQHGKQDKISRVHITQIQGSNFNGMIQNFILQV